VPIKVSGKKRKSEQSEGYGDTGFVRSKRTRSSAAAEQAAVGPSLDWDTFSPPASMIAGTPPAVFQSTPARQATSPVARTPPGQTTPLDSALKWKPVDFETLFDKENVPVVADLTDAEKQMTIEQFLMHEAKRQEDDLRQKMHKQVATMDTEFARALDAIDQL
jgi:hypothetical protein